MDQSTDFLMVGEITETKYITTKKGDKMAVIMVEDLLRTVEVIIFPVVFSQSEDAIQTGEIVAIKGSEETDSDGSVKVIASEIAKYSDLADLFM